MPTKLSEAANLDSVRFEEQSSAPATPASGYGQLYAINDGSLRWKDDAGTETNLVSGGGGATTALDNLASVAINTSLISDTDSTDDLGSTSIYWSNSYIDTMYVTERATPSTPAAGKGVIYAKNSDAKLYYRADDGTDYDLTASGGAWTEITAATALGSSQTTITFSSIPATYQDLCIVLNARGTATASNVQVTFNNDTAASYSYTYYGIANGSASNNETNNANALVIVNSVASSGATANYFGMVRIYISAYANSGITRSGHFQSLDPQSDVNISYANGSFFWENVAAAISEIDLDLNTGDFATGSTYALYGIGTAS